LELNYVFASGAFNEKQGKEVLTLAEKRRFYQESNRVIDALSEIGYPVITHHLLETLETLVEVEPKEVFLKIGRVIRAGKSGGYAREQLAVSLFVNLIQGYLAEHRELFQSNDDCRKVLLEVLDIFVQEGWPEARGLTYGLEDIFR
jgi:hypothetical protein